MESGINGDQNFYSRRLSASPEHNHQQQQQHHHPRPYDALTLPEFDARSPQLPPKLPFLTTHNLQAATSNGYAEPIVNGGDPDEFYRDYRGVHTNSFTSTSPEMAGPLSESRLPQSSLRSNGNGTTPKHPTLPQVRTALKPAYRSVSSPVDDRVLGNAKSTSALNGLSNTGKPSVKDLLKRFDQNNEHAGSAIRKPVPRTTAKDGGGPGYLRERGYQARSTTTGAVSRLPGAITRESGRAKSPTKTQRTRFAPEDQQSVNAQSAVPRRPRNAVTGANSQASKSMTNLSPTPPSVPAPQARKPLFGEILPKEQGTPDIDIAFGIPRTAARRTSESSLQPPWSTYRRNVPDIDVSPSSPTAWYLGVTPTLEDVNTTKPRPSPGHNRNHSDFQDSKVNTMNGVNPLFQTPGPPSTAAVVVQPPQSRLPKPSTRLSNSSDSSSPSPPLTRSPITRKALPNGKLRKAEQRPWSPTGRSMTPPPKEKTSRSSPRGRVRNPEKPTLNNASLKAYISAPLPKTSPPLRSSRPRLPVSSASTDGMRTKVADRSGSPHHVRPGMKLIRNNTDVDDVKKRTRSEVPMSKADFVQKRELIQRAYTRSIHESEQKKIRADNLRRLNERQAVQVPIASQPLHDTEIDAQLPVEVPLEEPMVEAKSPPLYITTTFERPEPVPQEVKLEQDSPTLGMPGTFVEDDDEPPPSAISNATGITEIENEPQTEAARLGRMPSRPSGLSSHSDFFDDTFSPEQAFFGMQNHGDETDEGNIQIMLAATPVEEPQPESTPTNEVFELESSSPVASQEEAIPVFNPTITVASPQTETDETRPATPLESGEDLPEVNEVNEVTDEVYVAPTEISIPGIYPETPEISQPDEPVEHVESPRIQLSDLRTALAPPSENGVDFLSTPTTDIEYESSDGACQPSSADRESFEHSYRNRDGHMSPGTFHSDHQSWRTDYSVGTAEDLSEREDFPYLAPSDEEQKPVPPPKEYEVSPEVPPKPEGYSPLPSPRFGAKAQAHPSPSRHQLPPISTGDGLGLGFATAPTAFNSSSAISLWPDYSPPPPPSEPDEAPPLLRRTPPPPSLYNRRPPSSAYQSSFNGNRISDSRRASDDLYSNRGSISTPRSSTQISFDDANNDSRTKLQPDPVMTEEEKKAAEVLRKRLFKRMMSIKELIDTEAVYIKDMNVVEEIYKGTAEACPKLDPGDIKTIFRNTNEIVDFSTMFLTELKSAASSVYSPRKRSRSKPRGSSPSTERYSVATTLNDETDDQKDRKTFIGSNFNKHLKQMQAVYTEYLKNSELANARLSVLQEDGAVKVWLGECNLVAKDLTGAWDLDALLVKPVQRITRYQLFLMAIKDLTPPDHPDHGALQTAAAEIGSLLSSIDDLKKRIHMVGQIVGRKRKESDVRTGIAKAFGRRSEKLAANPNRPPDDETYLKLHEKFGDDYLRLQVILRDAEYQTREATNYVNNNLRLFSSMELFMRMAATSSPEIESKWVRFNMSMRAVGSIGLDEHVGAVRTQVIEPVEKIIALYGPPGLAMKKRNKRRLDYEKSLALKSSGKKIDDKLAELVAQYEALNETLKLELPRLAALTNTIGQIFSTRLLHIQTNWWGIWKEKLSQNLEPGQMADTVQDITAMFLRDFKYSEARMQELGVINGNFGNGIPTRPSQSTQDDDAGRKGRPSNISSRSRSRGVSFNSDQSPSLPTPDFVKRHSGQFTFSPLVTNGPGLPPMPHPPHSLSTTHSRAGSGSPATPETGLGSRHHVNHARPSTSRSHTSEGVGMRQSNDYNSLYRRESGSTHNSHYVDGPPPSTRPYSGVFHSAMPLPDGPEDSLRSSRASSRERNISGGYNVLYLAASLFEFNISATKSEAGYPYLTYSAGEIFDVIGEKGELWLAKNQDDPGDQVGWIWSKHFARLATD